MKPVVIGIQDNFEGLNRVKGDDIHTARQRELIQNSWLKNDQLGYLPIKEANTQEQKIQDKLSELYIQQTKAKKSPK